MLMFFFFGMSLLFISYYISYPLYPFYFVVMMSGWLFYYPSSIIVSSFLGMDSLSWFLILLTLWITLFMFLTGHTYKMSGYYFDKFSFVIILMYLLLFLTFSSLETLSFYFFFESSLIPIYLLIMGWGYQPERLQAGLYLLMYTLFASLPLLVFFMYFNSIAKSLSFALLKDLNLFDNTKSTSLWFFVSIFAFLVKLPVFYVHLWLPKAHVEAPVSGSMMLAGVLLKLGCYGLMRVMPFFNSAVMFLSSLLVSLGLLGGIIVSFVCLRQVDLKALIAYSSVSHMGLALGGLGSWGMWGYSSCLYICVAHGLCSSGLFFLSGIIYDRSSSRSLMLNKGLLNVMPTMTFWWFMFCVSNMAAPVALNLVGELGLLGSILSFSFSCLFFLMVFSFLAACYSLYLFSSINYSKSTSGIPFYTNGVTREFLILFLHYFPLFFLILKVDFMSF
uniref:NADH-ubiquinone oxidoreductase chain 4 n=1 Tax=Arcoscalpellum epeeum TaxID=2498141 RepID=A0A3S9LPF3_9CRUS|nr:NADH dehydrogenase subunit 4 [Arcoscalpellum epeeum]